MPTVVMITIFWLLCIQTLHNYVGHFHSYIDYWGTIKPLGGVVV